MGLRGKVRKKKKVTRERYRSMGIHELCIFIRKSGYFGPIDRP